MAEDLPEDPNVAPADEAPPGSDDTAEDICPTCGGSGKRDGDECPDCRGTGRVTEAVGGG